MKIKALFCSFVLMQLPLFSVWSYAGPSQDANQYYPLRTGNTWVYDYGGGSTVRCEVLAYTPEYSAYLMKSEMKTIDVVIDTESVISNDGGRVARLGGTDIASGKAMAIFGHEETILASPVRPGAGWSYEKEGGKTLVECRVIEMVDCDVKAGHFKDACLVRRTTIHYDWNSKVKRREVRDEYYAPGVGLIKEEVVEDVLDAARGGREVQGTRELMELAKYRLMKGE